ncbi:MAG: HTH domain-containing protein [Clostridiales bacterium]|nr:HTH domain-containing protein [Clostridiales bacterium]
MTGGDKVIDVKIGLLFDYYGQFLTAKQREVMHLYFENDYSLSEIAEELHVSRQAVHDMIKKSKKALYEYEDRLGLALKFSSKDDAIEKIEKITDELISLVAAADAAAPKGDRNLHVDKEQLLSRLIDIKDIISNIE